MRKSGELIAEVSNQAISYNLCFISYVRLFDPVVCSAHNSAVSSNAFQKNL